MPGSAQNQRGRYHHGELRPALIEASFGLLAESGLAGFSVAQVARRLGISTAAPYRHFPDRDHLMVAVATQAAVELAEQFNRAAASAGSDPAERFVVTAGAYVRFVGTRGAGFDVIFAAGLERLQNAALLDAGRQLMDLLRELAEQAATGRDQETCLALVGQHLVAAHGYVTLYAGGFFHRQETIEEIAELAMAASRTLLRGTLAE